jgi:Domain of Unknown Function (DUF748)
MAFWNPITLGRRGVLLLLGTALALFAAYLIVGFYVAPGLIRSQATAWVKTNLHKTIAIGEIKVDPLRFALDIGDIAIPGPDAPMVAVGHLRVGFSLLSLFQDAYRLTELSIDHPFVQATIHPDGSLNLMELVPPPKPGESPAFRIDLFSVNEGRVAFADDSRPSHPRETLTPITFTLHDFHTKKDEGGEFALDARSQSNEGFSWRGTLSVTPIASQGHFTIANLQAATIARFLGDRLPVALGGGQIGVDGRYDFSYGPGGTRLQMAIARLALHGASFDGRDTLFHGAAHIDDASAALNFGFVSDAKGARPVAAALSSLSVHGVALTGTGPVAGQIIRLASVALDSAKLDFTAQRIALGALSLGGLDASVTREKDGAISLAKFLPAPPPSAPGAAHWTVQLASMTLADSAVHFEDRTVAPAARFDIAPIALSATNVGSDAAAVVNFQVTAGINAKGELKAEGTATPGTGAADVKLSLAKLPLRPAAAYLHYPALDLRAGELGAAGTVSLSGGEHSALHFAGDVAVENLSLYARANKSPLIAWHALRLTGIDYKPARVDIARARLSRPVGGIAILADRSFNFTTLIAPKVAVPAKAPPGAPAIAYSLKALDIDNGTVSFADGSIDPSFQARVQALSGSITNIASAPGTIARIDLKGQVIDRFSPVTIGGTANFAGYDRNTDIRVAFRNIELPIFNPYSGRYAGYAIGKGKLTTELHYKIVNRALEADHHIIIDQLEWGQASSSKPSVPWPVKLVTSLLKDRHGVIDLNLPVRGSLDDPTFRVGPIIWQIIGNLIEKIVTAPFALIGSLFEGADKAQFVDFAPGSSALPAGAADGLAALAKGLGDRPALQLDIPAAPALKQDALVIADARIDAALMANEIKKGQPADAAALSPDDRHDRLEDLYRARLGKRAAYPDALPPLASATTPAPDEKQQRAMQETLWLRSELRPAFLPGDPELVALGSARATAVRDALLAKGDIDPARVFLVTGETGTTNGDHVRLELKLR